MAFFVDCPRDAATRKATVRPIKKMTASACIQATVRISKSKRGDFSSPACGPLPVTSVPKIRTMNETITCMRDNTEIVFVGALTFTVGVWRRE